MKSGILCVVLLLTVILTACSTEPKTVEVTRMVVLPVLEVTREVPVEITRVVEVPIDVSVVETVIETVVVERSILETVIVEVEVPVSETIIETVIVEREVEVESTCVSPHINVPDYYPTDGLVAAYVFNGNTNDSSGNGYHLTTGGNPILVEDRFGNPSSAYSFDGEDDYFAAITLPAVGKEDGLVTWSAWFKTLDTNPSSVGPIFDSIGVGGVGLQNKRVKGDMELASGDHLSIRTFAYYDDDKWHNIIFSYNGLTLKLYVDGLLIGSVDDGSPIGNKVESGNGFSIGRNLLKPYFFKGEIDNVLIYDRELTTQEINDLSTWR